MTSLMKPVASAARCSTPRLSLSCSVPMAKVDAPISSQHIRRPDMLAFEQARRKLLLGAAAFVALPVWESRAAWDGASAATGSCPLGEEGDECRKQTLIREKARNGSESYSNVTKSRPQENGGLAVADMSDAYSRETLALKHEVEKYVNADLYDPERPKIVAALRKDGATWVAKYARGGSARKVSARRMYIAIDALQGHLASNGFAPFPRNKVPVLLANVQQSEQLLAEGK